MNHSRRLVLSAALAAISMMLTGCSLPDGQDGESEVGKTIVYVLGTIHAGHLDSDSYSLSVLEKAIRKANPDQILTEIPPDRLEEAERGFLRDGKVTEERVKIFPEYRDLIFPLSRELPFEIVATAGWTQELADYRRKALKRISQDTERAKQWAAHQAAQRAYRVEVAGRGDDPMFIHGSEFDPLVERAQQPYVRYFESDLGDGGWKSVNMAHNKLINQALDRISGQEKTVVVTFGSWHKYMILSSLNLRNDVVVRDSRLLFR